MCFAESKIRVSLQRYNFWAQRSGGKIDTAFENWDIIFSDYEYVRSNPTVPKWWMYACWFKWTLPKNKDFNTEIDLGTCQVKNTIGIAPFQI